MMRGTIGLFGYFVQFLQDSGAMQNEASYCCDVCGEEIVVPVDVSAGEVQEYVEDCPVCCHPHVLRVEMDRDGTVRLTSQTE